VYLGNNNWYLIGSYAEPGAEKLWNMYIHNRELFNIKPTAELFQVGKQIAGYNVVPVFRPEQLIDGYLFSSSRHNVLPIDLFLADLPYEDITTNSDGEVVRHEAGLLEQSKQYYYTTRVIGSPDDFCHCEHVVYRCVDERFVRQTVFYTGVVEATKRSVAYVRRYVDMRATRKSRVDKTYRTRYGPCVYHEGVILADDDNGLAKSIRRLTCARGDLSRGLEDEGQLTNNQLNICHSKSARNMFRAMRNALRHTTRVMPELYIVIRELVKMPHPKRKMRLQAFSDVLQDNILFREIWNENVIGKVKRDEIAKPGKYTRLVNDLTTPVSLIGAVLAKLIKQCMADSPVLWNGCRAKFVDSPSADKLVDAFSLLINPVKDVEFVYFSDDSCLSVKTEDGVKMYNMDISSCDASHSHSIFRLFVELFEGREQRLVKQVVEQLKLPLTLKSASGTNLKIKKGGYVDETFVNVPCLYSGSVLTTLMNNLANLLIFNAIADSTDRTPDGIIKAAASAGYIVTLDECRTYHGLQFLKHSPVLTRDGLRAMVNIGVFIRSFGQCKGDLPGRKTIPIEERARRFTAGYINSFKHGGGHPLMDCVRLKYRVKDDDECNADFYWLSTDGTAFDVPVDEICMRYGITNSMYFEMVEYFNLCGLGNCIDCYATRAIISKDYGLCEPFSNGKKD